MQDLLKPLFVIAVGVLAACILLAMLATLGAINLSNGCLERYTMNNGQSASADTISNTVILRADANYTTTHTTDSNGVVTISRDASKDANGDYIYYGSWLNSNVNVKPNQRLNIHIQGNVSLCQGYLPTNNLGSSSNTDVNGKVIAIPRVEDSEGLPLIFSTTSRNWANAVYMYRNDHVQISLGKSIAGGSALNIFTNQIIHDDFNCADGRKTYSPVCNRYSPYVGVQYQASCGYSCSLSKRCICHTDLYGDNDWANDTCNNTGTCFTHAMLGTRYNRLNAAISLAPISKPAPIGYPSDGSTTIAAQNLTNNVVSASFPCSDPNHQYANNWNLNETNYVLPNGRSIYRDNTTPPDEVLNICANFPANFPGQYQTPPNVPQPPIPKFWCTADDGCGVQYRFNTRTGTTNTTLASMGDNNIIFDQTFADNDDGYLQFSFYDNSVTNPNNSGGYVFYIKQTKCVRTNGEGFGDPGFMGRGNVRYLMLPPGVNPNDPNSQYNFNPQDLPNPDSNGNVSIQAPNGDSNSYLWLIINNNVDDYVDSIGQYNVRISTSQPVGSFAISILSPLFEKMRNMVRSAFETTFKNMTCYGDGTNLLPACTNFFSYIRGLLSLYVMSYAMMFLLGMVEISQKDLVIRVIKVGLVAGLMNESTFNYFSMYVFDFVTGFSDEIISNMSGYSLFSDNNSITNPFMFMDALLSKIFFSKTFMGQLFALMSMGLSGLLYFIIVLIALIIMIIALFKAMSVYIMAFLSVAVLMGLAPLFLTFMLFDFTKHLFDNWVRFTFRYIVEPVILMAGLIILTQLFTIYLDFVLGYSVCWKCALGLTIPFPNIAGFTPAFANVPLFCINWFAPWGFDSNSGMMGINMQYMIAMVIIAYTMYGYSNLSGKMVTKLTRTSSQISATKTGDAMASKIGDHMLAKVGLDSQSREKIKSKAKDRLKNKLKSKTSGRKNGIKGDIPKAETKGEPTDSA